MKKALYLFAGLQAIFFSTALFAAENAPVEVVDPRDQQGLTQTFIMIAVALAFFYLILWRPEQKRRKAMEEQRAALKTGDRVNAMGIVGTIVRVEDNTVILRMVDGSKIEMLKAAISDVIPGSVEDVKKDDSDKAS